ncbi:MAG: ABC transporter permease [Acidobacteria bacterium]|nr:MAG: ABC transporter permease [Acidobacteriota bacterium]
MKRQKTLLIDVIFLLLLLIVVSVVFLDRPHLFPRSSQEINLQMRLLPLYALYSFLRMLSAYALALIFSICVGYFAAVNLRARKWILPALDIFQSIPILAFFPAAVFFFIRLFRGHPIGVEFAEVFLIFTSQVWNMAFSVYESIITIPEDLLLAADEFNVQGWRRWRRLILPACVPRLTYNSMLSWAGGWYFLTASEIIAIGPARYTLPGLGSYIGQAMNSGRMDLMLAGLLSLVGLVVLLYILVWNPANWWSQNYLYEMSVAASGRAPMPAIARWIRRSRVLRVVNEHLFLPGGRSLLRLSAELGQLTSNRGFRLGLSLLFAGFLVLLGYGIFLAVRSIFRPLAREVAGIPLAILLSFLRLLVAYLLSLAWTIPVAILVGQSKRLARWLLPAVQITASIPATAFFPLLVILTLSYGLSMNGVAILLVLTGMQWYLLFNLIAGVLNIPADLKEVSQALGLRGWRYWKRVLFPAMLPSLVTGSITAWGGGWNALIISEFVEARGQIHRVRGIGALLDQATYQEGNLQVIVFAVMSMVIVITVINKAFWRPTYAYVSEKFKMEY